MQRRRKGNSKVKGLGFRESGLGFRESGLGFRESGKAIPSSSCSRHISIFGAGLVSLGCAEASRWRLLCLTMPRCRVLVKAEEQDVTSSFAYPDVTVQMLRSSPQELDTLKPPHSWQPRLAFRV